MNVTTRNKNNIQARPDTGAASEIKNTSLKLVVAEQLQRAQREIITLVYQYGKPY